MNLKKERDIGTGSIEPHELIQWETKISKPVLNLLRVIYFKRIMRPLALNEPLLFLASVGIIKIKRGVCTLTMRGKRLSLLLFMSGE